MLDTYCFTFENNKTNPHHPGIYNDTHILLSEQFLSKVENKVRAQTTFLYTKDQQNPALKDVQYDCDRKVICTRLRKITEDMAQAILAKTHPFNCVHIQRALQGKPFFVTVIVHVEGRPMVETTVYLQHRDKVCLATTPELGTYISKALDNKFGGIYDFTKKDRSYFYLNDGEYTVVVFRNYDDRLWYMGGNDPLLNDVEHFLTGLNE